MMDISSELDLSKGCVILDFSTTDADRRNADELLSFLRARSIRLALDSVLRPSSLKEVNTLPPVDFSVLILFAHGMESPSETGADVVIHPESVLHHNPGVGTRGHWFNVVTMLPENSDTIVLLAVCDGYCQDSQYLFCVNSGYAAVLIGPTERISGGEAFDAYSTLLAEIYGVCGSGMITNISRVAEAFPRANARARGMLAMRPTNGT